MRKQYQTSWHSIDFDDFIVVSDKSVADINFYQAFYKKFFENYSSYSEIPKKYVESKMPVVRFLESKLQSKVRVLSIGCGIGLIENLLSERNKVDAKIVVTEPSEEAIKWINLVPSIEVHNGFFPSVFRGNLAQDFDYGYARAVEYIFNNDEYVKFLKSIVDFGIKEFSIISVCIHRKNISTITKELIKSLLSSFGLYDRGQFWGYLRTKEDHQNAFLKAGFIEISFNQLDQATLVITGRV